MPDAPPVERLSELLEKARAVREFSYAPYSKYRVGAALVTRTGRVFVGCNVENATYGATLCAERAAVAAMIAQGERELAGIVVFTDGDPLGMPCGICRQTLSEFGNAESWVVAAAPGEQRLSTVGELLPDAFSLRR